MSAPSEPLRPRASFRIVAPLLVVVAGIGALGPHQFTDADTLSRLATGRLIATAAELPERDPFTYARPDAALGHPEWLADVALYRLYEALGEGGLQALVLVVVAAGWSLSLLQALRVGASPWLACAFMLALLPLSAPRFLARNDLHATWLLPLLVWLLASARAARPATWLALLGLGALWSQLHTSFLLGWLLLLAGLWQQQRAHRKAPVAAWVACGVYPLIPLLGPTGSASYTQALDHLLHADIYRAHLSEWRSPLSAGGWLATGPLYLLLGLGAAALFSARARLTSPVLSVAAFLLGAGLSLSSRRFCGLAVVLALPPAVAAMSSVLAGYAPSARKRLATAGLVLCVLYLALGLRTALHRSSTSILADASPPMRAATFIAQHAPAGSKLFNPFNDGPWLLWLSASRVQHYWDPRNHLGASFVEHVMREVLPQPAVFDAEVAQLGTSLALISSADPFQVALAKHLSRSAQWKLVFWDGVRELWARDTAGNAALIAGHGYEVLQPTVDPAYWIAAPHIEQLDRDLKRLAEQAPALAADIARYRSSSGQ